MVDKSVKGNSQKNVEVSDTKLSFFEKAKAQVRKLAFEAQTEGKLVTKNQDLLTLSVNGQKYTVFLSKNTLLRPKYWGHVDLTDFNLGDDVTVIGVWKNKADKEISATLIRDLSNEKRWGVFLGDIVSKGKNNIVIMNKPRGEMTVVFDGKTKFIDKNNKTVNMNTLKTGDRVRAKGIFDNKKMRITEVEELKDFSAQ